MESDQPFQLNLEFVKKLAHDIKGPVGNTVMFSQLLEEKLNMLEANASEQNRDEVAHVKELSYTIVQINKKLLTQLQCWVDAFEMDHGSIEVEKTGVAAGEIVEEVKEMNRIYLDKKRIELNTEQIDRDAVLNGSKNLLFQILDQLITLSITFAEQNSSIKVKGGKDEAYYRFSVVDHYQGNRDSAIRRYTEPPGSIDTQLPEEGILKSAAFGMIFCNLAIENMGGEKGVDHTADGNSTEFWFTVPVS